MENEEIVRGKMIKPLVVVTVVTAILAMIIAAVIKLTLYVNNNEFAWKFPIQVTTQRILTVSPREKVIVHTMIIPTYPEEIDTDIEKYICDKFGVMDCKMALAVAKAESGLNCNAVHINSNGTADLSIFQLNTVHLKKGGEWTLANMGDCKKNIDLAHKLWTEQGWEPWVAYLNNSYLASY